MEEIDRLGWAAGMSIVAFGVRIGIRLSDAAVLSEVVALLPAGWRPARSNVVDHLMSVIVGGPGPGGVRRFNLLYADARRLARTLDPAEMLGALERYVKSYVVEAAPRRVFVRAGVVGWRGRAIVLAGDGPASRAALVTALVRAGGVRYSDEYAVFDARGRVHPYPGAVARLRPLPVALVAMTRPVAGARWRPRPLSPGEAMLELLARAAPARVKPEATLSTLERAVSGARAIEGRGGEADELAESLLRLSERAQRHAEVAS